MQNENYDKKKITTLVITAAVVILAIIVIALINIIPKLGKVEVYVGYATFVANITLDGKAIKNNEKTYLESGEYELSVSYEGFSSIEETVVVDKETTALYGNITAQTEAAKKIANEHLNDYAVVEGYASAELQKQGMAMEKEWPIITKLPISNSLYKIGYVTENNEIKLTVNTSLAYVDVAVDKLKNAASGVDTLAKYSIEFSGFSNTLNGKFVENDKTDPAEYIKTGFSGVSSFSLINSGQNNEYYLARVSTGSENTYSLVHYVVVLKKEDEKWKLVSSKIEPIATVYNTIDVPVNVLDIANSL